MKPLLAACSLLLAACTGGGSSSSSSSSSSTGGTAGPFVEGAPDTHCALADGGTRTTHVDPAACGTADGGTPALGATLFSASGMDDACKYRVTAEAEAVATGSDAMFTITVTGAEDGQPVLGATAAVEAFLSSSHAAPDAGTSVFDLGGGRYHFMPVRLDQPGRWTVRFHLDEQCSDEGASPRGHIAFYLDVP